MLRLLVASILLSGLLGCSSSAETVEVHFRKSDGSVSPTVRAELAVTQGSRELGLMYRKKLGDQEGMLFMFPEETERSFWMKNTYLELDIIYMNSQWKIVSISERAVPLTTSSRPSRGPSQYVLEVNGGKARAWDLAPGNELIVPAGLPPAR